MAKATASPGFGGEYVGAVQGTPTALQLELVGDTLSGQANADGYIYQLTGTVHGGRATGQILDPQTGALIGFEAVLHGDSLTLSMAFPDLFTGQFNNISMQFQRRSTTPEPAGGTAAPQDKDGERDPAIIGEWMRSESMSGGGIAVVSQERLRIGADGSFVRYDPKIAGPMGTMTGPESISGTWRTENGFIFTMLQGQPQWVRYGRYEVGRGSLMFTLPDGSTELWQRQA